MVIPLLVHLLNDAPRDWDGALQFLGKDLFLGVNLSGKVRGVCAF
jgi:hypothetical protein